MLKLLYWFPRCIAILFTIFLSLFALDSFSLENWLIAFLIHLIPTFILIFLTIISWKHEMIGGILFVLVGIFMIFYYDNGVIPLPVIIAGGLFMLHSCMKKRLIS